MKELLKHGADPNMMNNASQTIVFIACWHNKLKALKLLVENGADINIPDQRGWTPLMVAVNKNYAEIVEYLINKGVNVDQKDTFGKKAIDRAETDEIFFLLTSKSMNERIRTSMCIEDNSKFRDKSPKFYNSEKKMKKILKNISTNELANSIGNVERGSQTSRSTLRTSKHFSHNVTFEEQAVVDGVLRK